MNPRTRNSLIVRLFLLGVFFVSLAHAQIIPSNLWNPNYASSTITPRPSTLQVPCANIVGGCVGAASATAINGVAGPTFTFSIVSTSSASSITTSSQQVFLNILQNTSSSDITISPTGTIVFANHNISQFTNNSGYITTSTNNFGGITNASVTALSPVVWSTTSTISCPTCSTVSTSSANTWSQVQTFSGVSNTGNETSTSYSSNSASSSIIDYLNGKWTVRPDYATAGFAGSSTLTDLGAIANYAYLANSSTQSSTVINLTSLPQFTPYTTPIVFGTNGQYVDLECNPGQVLEFNATSGVAITYNEGTGIPSSSHLPHLGGRNCIFATATTTAGGTTDIVIGGSNGESQLSLENFGAIQAGIGWNSSSNAYMVSLTNPMARKDTQEWVGNTANNSGESFKLYGVNFVDPANASATNCIDLKSSAYASFEMFGGSIDDCQETVEAGNLSVNHYGVHRENPAATTYGQYDFLNILSSANCGSSVNDFGGIYMNDGTSTAGGAPNEFVNYGSCFSATDDVLAHNGPGTSTARFLNNTNSTGNGYATITNTNNSQGGVVALFQAGNALITTNFGTLTSVGNSYATGFMAGTAGSNGVYIPNGNGFIFNSTIPGGGGAGTSLNAIGGGVGTSTPSSTWQVEGSNSSTLEIGNAGSSNNSRGCLEMGTASGTQKLEFIGIDSAGVFFATSTRPAWCN